MTGPDLPILFESGPVLAISKPSGLLTQAPPGIDSVELRIKEWLRQREGKTGNVYLGVPHRLDRPATGVLVLARHSRATRRLAEQFEGRLVKKVYWACVVGQVEPRDGTWTDWLIKVPGEPRAEVVSCDHPDARQAVLHYQTIGRHRAGTWLEIELETGRTHQVRIQAASRGWPIVGDAQYGSTLLFGPAFDDARLRAIALHARSLDFRHPMTHEPIQVVAPLPDAWQELGLTANSA